MQKFLLFVCGFAEMAGIASILTLGLSGVIAIGILILPVILLILVLLQPGRAAARQARWERERQVQVYVPLDQRMSGQVTQRQVFLVPGEEEYPQRYPSGPLQGGRW